MNASIDDRNIDAHLGVRKTKLVDDESIVAAVKGAQLFTGKAARISASVELDMWPRPGCGPARAPADEFKPDLPRSAKTNCPRSPQFRWTLWNCIADYAVTLIKA